MKRDNILEAIGHTPLVELARISPKQEVRLFAKLEGQNLGGSASVKDRVAKYMIEKAEESGLLTPDKTILEATSGNTGIALAMIGRRKGYKVKVIMPDNVSVERRQILQLYGAQIQLTKGEKGVNYAFDVAETQAMREERYVMLNQFSNPANPLAHYETTGVEILEDLPDLTIDVFIAGIGTGGTLMGVGKRLRERNPRLGLIGVEPPPKDPIPGLRNLTEGFIPPVLDLNFLDERVVVSSREAIAVARKLLQTEGIFAGISSGAIMCQAIKVAQRMDRGNIVVVLPDGGWKYLSIWTTLTEEPEEGITGMIRQLFSGKLVERAEPKKRIDE